MILSVENHCSPAQQDMMAKLMVDILGRDNIYIGSASASLSPHDLRGKFLIKAQIFPKGATVAAQEEGPPKEPAQPIVSTAFKTLM